MDYSSPGIFRKVYKSTQSYQNFLHTRILNYLVVVRCGCGHDVYIIFYRRHLLCILFTAIIAIIVPSFGAVLGVIGAVSGSSFALILPALFDIKLFFHTMSLASYIKSILYSASYVVGLSQ